MYGEEYNIGQRAGSGRLPPTQEPQGGGSLGLLPLSKWTTQVAVKVRQDLPELESNSNKLQKILGVKFRVGPEIWSDKCMPAVSTCLANFDILDI